MKRLFILVFTIIMIVSMLAFAESGDDSIIFNDVLADYWAASEIEYFASNNIVNGIGDGLFEPESKVTREQLCKIMVLTFNADSDDSDEQIFSDVEPDRWSFAYINKCRDFLTGYINPFGGLPSFRPEEYATREDVAVALVRMMGIKEPEVIFQYFADEEEFSPNLRKYIWTAHQYGLINGYPDGTFRPKDGVTRAEAVVLLDRATKQALSDFTDELFIDVEEHSAYAKSSEYVAIVIKSSLYANVTVDGAAVDMGPYGVGGCHIYFNKNESKKTINITASRYGESITKQFTIKNEGRTPILTITSDIPEKTDFPNITISGTLDWEPNTKLAVNSILIAVGWDGKWSCDVPLKSGENKITIKAVNEFGESTIIKKIWFDADNSNSDYSNIVDKPQTEPTTLNLNLSYPEISTSDTAIITGTVEDSSEEPVDIKVIINDEIIYLKNGEPFSKKLRLLPEENIFLIEAYSETSNIISERIIILYQADENITEPEKQELNDTGEISE